MNEQRSLSRVARWRLALSAYRSSALLAAISFALPVAFWCIAPLTAQSLPDSTLRSTHGFEESRYYTIQPGDTIYSIALEIGVDLEETYCLVAPDYTWATPLVIGDVLEVPASSVHCHEVGEGETLAILADLYDTTAETISAIRWNSLAQINLVDYPTDAPLPVGLHLRVPPLEQNRPVDLNTATAELTEILAMKTDTIPFVAFAVGGPNMAVPEAAVPANWPYGSGYFRWPTSGWLSQGYHTNHKALDIAAPHGSAVRAADRGVVIRAGWNAQGYGNLVIIDHNIDYVTLYAHLSEIHVKEGDIVGAGELIGVVGSTGNSTGAHLHFEIRDFGQRTDPLLLLTR